MQEVAKKKSNTALTELKARVERSWTELQQPHSVERKAELRGEYEQAMAAYQRQKLISEGSDVGGSNQPRHAKKVRFTAPVGERPSPFAFADYREFLIAWIKYLKFSQGMTIKVFADKVGLAPPLLVRILKHWKPMSLDDFKKVTDAFELSSSEKAFLEALHCMSETPSQALRLASLRRMLAFAEFRKRNPQEYEAWRYLSHWYYVAIREMSTQAGFRADAPWVRARLRKQLPLAEVRKALKFLEGAGFFKVLPDGKVEPRLKEINCTGGVFRLALGTFHREMLELANESIETVPSAQRLLLGRTITISAPHLEAARSILEEALEKISQLGTAGTSKDDVHHFELTMIPLTRGSEVD